MVIDKHTESGSAPVSFWALAFSAIAGASTFALGATLVSLL